MQCPLCPYSFFQFVFHAYVPVYTLQFDKVTCHSIQLMISFRGKGLYLYHKDHDSNAGILFKILVHCKADLSRHAEVIDVAIHQILKPSDIGYNGGYGMQLLELAYKQEPAFKDEFLLVVNQVYDTIEKQYVLNCADRLLKRLNK